MHKIKSCGICLLFFLAVMSSPAQERKDLFSQTGPGRLEFNETALLRSMPAAGPSFIDDKAFSFQNPASLAGLKLTTYSVAMKGRVGKIRQGDSLYDEQDIGFHYFSLAFPVIKKVGWGASFGLVPFSAVDYSFKSAPPTKESNFLDYNNGKGGLSKFFIGNSVSLGKHLNLGVNVAFIFGKIRKNFDRKFPVYENQFSTRNETVQRFGDLSFDAGLQYHRNLTDDLALRIGASGRVPKFYRSTWREVIFSYSNLGKPIVFQDSSLLYLEDGELRDYNSSQYSLLQLARDTGKVLIPGKYTLGVQLHKMDHWRIAGAFYYAPWSQFDNPLTGVKLNDSWKASLSGEFIPDDDAYRSFWKRVRYRFGVNFAQTRYGKEVKDMSINAGFGIPVKRNESVINLGVEAGKLGDRQAGTLEEQYVKFYFGFNFNDKWFIKRKIR